MCGRQGNDACTEWHALGAWDMARSGFDAMEAKASTSVHSAFHTNKVLCHAQRICDQIEQLPADQEHSGDA